MLLTPTFVGLLLAGAAFWTLIWAAIHKLDEIPYLKEFTSTQEVLGWIQDHKGLTLVGSKCSPHAQAVIAKLKPLHPEEAPDSVLRTNADGCNIRRHCPGMDIRLATSG